MKEKIFRKGTLKRYFAMLLMATLVLSGIPIQEVRAEDNKVLTCSAHNGIPHWKNTGGEYNANYFTGTYYGATGAVENVGWWANKTKFQETQPGNTADDSWWYFSDDKYYSCNGTHIIPHTHGSWGYTAEGATLTAECKADGDCDLTDNKVSLTLSASDPNYDGSAATIDIGTDDEITAWEAAELTVPTEISYEKADGTPLEAAPTTVGNYVAKVSPVGEEVTEANTAKVSFEIIPIAVTGISLDKTSMDLAKNATSALTATVSPANATNKTVTWSTSNENVATVRNTGVVTAVGSGVAVITAECGDFSVECAVTVYANTYTLTVPATAEAAGAGFNAVGNVNVKGNIAGDKKIVVKASGSDNNTFKSTTVSTTVGYTIVKGNAAEKTEIPAAGLEFSNADVNTETGTSVAVGIIVNEADYIKADDGDYTTTVTWKASLSSVSAE